MKQRIRLDTMTDVQQFIKTTSQVSEAVTLEDGNGFCVNAKSLLGSLYAMEFTHIYCCCERDIAGLILPWIV